MPANVEEAFIQPFEEANPGIKLEILGQESINDTLRTAIQAGEAPDILQTPGASFIAEYVDAGSVVVLDDYAADLGWEDKLLDWAYQSGQLGGNLYSIPLTYESMVLFYNKSLFDENGWEVPTTLEELNAVAAAAEETRDQSLCLRQCHLATCQRASDGDLSEQRGRAGKCLQSA